MGSVLFSGFRYSHHNLGSGYDGVVHNNRDYVCGNLLPFSTYPEPSYARKLNFLLVDVLTLIRGMKYSAIHYFYPEDTSFFSPLILKCIGKTIIYTIHSDKERWLSPARNPFWWMKRQCLKHAAGVVISLSSAQAIEFQQLFPDKRVFFVPLGLDMNTPAPGDEQLIKRFDQLRVVMVGSNYRDFDMLEKIIRSRSIRPATFHLIGLDKANRKRFANVPGVTCYDRLEAEEYAELLQSSFIMALPLTFATANCALLEAHKFYLPAVCSDIPGVRDYATEDTVLFSRYEDFWNAFDRLVSLGFPAYRDVCVRTHKEAQARFSWSKIRRELITALQD